MSGVPVPDQATLEAPGSPPTKLDQQRTSPVQVGANASNYKMEIEGSKDNATGQDTIESEKKTEQKIRVDTALIQHP